MQRKASRNSGVQWFHCHDHIEMQDNFTKLWVLPPTTENRGGLVLEARTVLGFFLLFLDKNEKIEE